MNYHLPSVPNTPKSDIKVPNDPYNRTMDDIAKVEMRASRHAAKYFGDHYGVDWNYLEGNSVFKRYPLYYKKRQKPLGPQPQPRGLIETNF